jgi:hypothetical protein
VPSDTLISVISVQARIRIGLDPARVWQRADARWKTLLSNIRTHTTLEVLEESREPDLKQIYLLNFNRFLDSTNTLNGRLRIGQEVNLFRAQSRYGLDAAFNQVRGLNELTAGEERRLLRNWRVEGRYRLASRWSARLTSEWEKNRVTSQFFASRRYDIRGWSLEPELSFQPTRALRLTGQVDYARKVDGVGDRRARVIRIPVDARYSVVRRLAAFTRVEVANVALEGEARGEAQFELTDGRGPGTSYLWSVQGNYALNQYLNASFAYDGRSPSSAPTLHTVRLTFSAVF